MKILHWYYDLMNLYGDYGNLEVLRKHLEDQGFEPVVEKKTIHEEVNIESYDMIYIGSGTEKKQELVREDILRFRKDLRMYIEEEGILLATGNAMELFGKTVDTRECLGFLPFDTGLTKDRYTGDVILHNEEMGDIVGFINKCSLIAGGEKEKLFDYVFRDANLKDNDYEGYEYKNLIGTHVIGPVLVKNPAFMKKIVLLLGKKNDPDFQYKEIEYPFEEDSYQVTHKALLERRGK